jgi:hypothetical protein
MGKGAAVVPVAALDHFSCVVWVCTEAGRSRLLLWNSITKKYSFLLSERHIPVMPSVSVYGRAFCFIENDFLKYKSFDRRSCKTFDFSFPLYDLKFPIFVGDNYILFSAILGNRMRAGIFVVNLFSDYCFCLVSSPFCDFLFPFFYHGCLFCVERSDERDDLLCIPDIVTIIRKGEQESIAASSDSFDQLSFQPSFDSCRFFFHERIVLLCQGGLEDVLSLIVENGKEEFRRYNLLRDGEGENILLYSGTLQSIYEANIIRVGGKLLAGGYHNGQEIQYNEAEETLVLRELHHV